MSTANQPSKPTQELSTNPGRPNRREDLWLWFLGKPQREALARTGSLPAHFAPLLAASEALLDALRLFLFQKEKEALAALRHLPETEVPNGELLLAKGHWAAEAGDWPAAALHYRAATELPQPSPRAWLNLAIAAERNAQTSSSPESWQEAASAFARYAAVVQAGQEAEGAEPVASTESRQTPSEQERAALRLASLGEAWCSLRAGQPARALRAVESFWQLSAEDSRGDNGTESRGEASGPLRTAGALAHVISAAVYAAAGRPQAAEAWHTEPWLSEQGITQQDLSQASLPEATAAAELEASGQPALTLESRTPEQLQALAESRAEVRLRQLRATAWQQRQAEERKSEQERRITLAAERARAHQEASQRLESLRVDLAKLGQQREQLAAQQEARGKRQQEVAEAEAALAERRAQWDATQEGRNQTDAEILALQQQQSAAETEVATLQSVLATNQEKRDETQAELQFLQELRQEELAEQTRLEQELAEASAGCLQAQQQVEQAQQRAEQEQQRAEHEQQQAEQQRKQAAEALRLAETHVAAQAAEVAARQTAVAAQQKKLAAQREQQVALQEEQLRLAEAARAEQVAAFAEAERKWVENCDALSQLEADWEVAFTETSAEKMQQLAERLSSRPEAPAQRLAKVAKAYASWWNCRWLDAENSFAELRQEEPEEFDWLRAQLHCRQAMGDFGGQLDLLEEAVSHSAWLPELRRLWLGLLRKLEKEYRQKPEWLREQLERGIRLWEGQLQEETETDLWRLAQRQREAKQWEAVALTAKRLADRPNSLGVGDFLAAEALVQQGQHDQAAELFGKAAEQLASGTAAAVAGTGRPTVAQARFNQGLAHWRNHAYEQAYSTFASLADQLPDADEFKTETMVCLLELALERRQAERAKLALDWLENLAPLPAEYLFNTALCLEEQGASDEAEALYRRSLEREGDHRETLINLGHLLRERQPDEALHLFERAASLRQTA